MSTATITLDRSSTTSNRSRGFPRSWRVIPGSTWE